MSAAQRYSDELRTQGYIVLDDLYPDQVIEEARRRVVDNIGLFKNTRPNPSAGHIAGFHRYPQLEHLHLLISSNETVGSILRTAAGSSLMRTIGLSDITINRSQEWHVDLLRGKYQEHLHPELCWGPQGGGVYKALLYLQPGKSLKVVPGAHVRPIPLDADHYSRPENIATVRSIDMRAGAIILMDLRLPHRGFSEEELGDGEFRATPKILISTVFGGDDKPLTTAMEVGNSHRLHDWDALHAGTACAQLH